MAKSINKVVFIGNIIGKPELRYTEKGVSFCTFIIETSREWTVNKDKKSEKLKHYCIVWEKLAEICANILDQDNLVYLEGRLDYRRTVDEKGTPSFKTSIVVNEMIKLKGNEVEQVKEEVKND